MTEVYKKNTWLKEDSMDTMIKIVTFIMSPFISFLYSLKRINTKSSFIVFFLFALIYGLCFTVIADNMDVWEHNDAAKWRFRFENTKMFTISDYVDFCSDYFLFIGTEINDLYFVTLSFVVHFVSDNYHVFFMSAALVFSYFQLKSFRFLVDSPAFDNSIVCLMICMLFSLNTIANISVLRFATAAWMCVYGVLQILYNRKVVYLVLLFVLPLIHRAFFFMYPVFLLTFFLRDKSFWKYLYFFSVLFSGFSIYIIRDATNYLPSFLSGMIEAYTVETTFERNSLTKTFLNSINIIYDNVLFMLIMNTTRTYLPEKVKSMYQFTLIFMSIVNFVMPVPSLGGRFATISEVFIAFLWLNIMGTKNKYNILIYLMPVFLIRKLYIVSITLMKFQDVSILYTNPFTLISSHL